LISDTIEKLELAGENGTTNWFAFTFLTGRMTEVLTPDIYIELTDKMSRNDVTTLSQKGSEIAA
jgi:hypothetical protein